MPRRKSIASIDAKISDLQKKAAAAKERYERLCRELLQLQHERELAMGQEILSAMKKSGKSYREIMTFLGSPWGLSVISAGSSGPGEASKSCFRISPPVRNTKSRTGPTLTRKTSASSFPSSKGAASCKWIEWSRSPDNELEALKFTTVIRHQDGTHLLLEVMQHPCNEGTMVYFIDLEKAISCQRHLIRTCLESEVNQYVSLDYNSLDTLCAMEILADYDGLYTPSRNYRIKVEQYGYNLVLLSDRACYRCIISTDDGQEETVCFEMTGFASGGVFVTPRTSIPGTYSLSASIYKKRREIG